MKKCIVLVVCLIIALTVANSALAQDQKEIPQYEALIVGEKSTALGRLYEVQIQNGPEEGKKFSTTSESGTQKKSAQFKKGEKVLVAYTTDPQGKALVYIVDRVRSTELLILFTAFIALVIVIGKLKGLMSLLGMAISFVVIVQLILPGILGGSDPVYIALLSSIFILPLMFFLGHGFSKKTIIAMGGTFLGLILTGVLAYVSVFFVRLTGFAAEEAVFIQTLRQGDINMVNLLIAGIIIGALGVLDDVTISQTAIVEKLHDTNRAFTFKELFRHAMDIGRDHIASLVNTLVLVYTGAALPLLLLFRNTESNLGIIFNQEIVATEVVRTLVSSIGIIAAVPITTALAAYFYSKR